MSFIKPSLLFQFKRAFATQPTAASVKIPLTLHGIDGRYASALYSAAAKKNMLSQVETELNKMKTVIDKDAKLLQFLESPIIQRHKKVEGVQLMLKQGTYSDTTKNLFIVMAENGRLDLTLKVMESFATLMSAHRGEVLVTVTSTKPLDTKTLNQVKKSLESGKSLIKEGQKINISNKVNPAILGGLLIEVGDKTIDLTAATKMARLSKIINATI